MIYPNDFINKNICGNSVDKMQSIPEGVIDLVVTSPPYDNLRTYKGGVKDDISYEEGYSFPFVEMVRELYRIMKKGGIVVWVVNDQVKDGGETGTSFRMALKFQELGFKIYDTMIYHKNGSPFSETGRYSQVFEYMFIFLKGDKPNTVNLLKDKPNKWAGSSTFGEPSVRQKDGTLKKKNSFIVGDYGTRYNVWQINNGKGFGGDELSHLHPACVDPETECLTINGWKKYNEIYIGDEILSYNINSNCLEWDKIKNIHISNYIGDMITMFGRRLSIITTPNHRNVIKLNYNNNIKIIESKDLKYMSHMILTSCDKNNNIEKINENLSYLLGIIITDGYINKSYIGISQDYVKNKHNVDKIISCIEKLGLRYTFGKRERYYYYDGKKILKNMIRFKKEFLDDHKDYKISYDMDIRIWDKNEILKWIPDKKINNKLFKLDKLSIQKIIEGIIDGDGCNRDTDDSYIVTGKYDEFHGNLQILCVLAGYTSDYFEKNNRYTQIIKSEHKLLRNSKGSIIKTIKYNGVVWCPEVEKNGTFIARRNGKVFITGNSFPESLAEDHILSWSNEGDIVLDPMMGSGTVAKMAKMNNRKFIGIDLQQEYIDICNKRVEVESYTEENPNPKKKFIVSKEEMLEKRRKTKEENQKLKEESKKLDNSQTSTQQIPIANISDEQIEDFKNFELQRPDELERKLLEEEIKKLDVNQVDDDFWN